MTEFETNTFVQISCISLGIFNLSFYFGHFLIINKLNKQNISIDDVTCFGIIAKIITSTLFFLLLYKFPIINTEFLKVSYLIGLVLNFEWLAVYVYYYHRNKISLVIINMLIGLVVVASLFLLFIFLVSPDNYVIKTIMIQISFLAFVISFITPGFNLIKFYKSFDAKYIFLYDAITGVLVAIGTFLYEFCLCKYNILGWGNIAYVVIAIAVCVLQIIYFVIKNKGSYKVNKDLLIDENNDDEDEDNVGQICSKKISLVAYNSQNSSE